MAMLRPQADNSIPRKNKSIRRIKPVIDLKINEDSESFKGLEHAYASGERVSAKGMSAEQFLDALLGKPSPK